MVRLVVIREKDVISGSHISRGHQGALTAKTREDGAVKIFAPGAAGCWLLDSSEALKAEEARPLH